MVDTNRSITEIEVALAEYFEYLKTNIVVFNVTGMTGDIDINHECDCLVISKAGYLTEIEIKRSWSDFLADFKKKHTPVREKSIKYFYYCVPEKLCDKVYDKLDEIMKENEDFNYSGLILYDEDLRIYKVGKRVKSWRKTGDYDYDYVDCAIGYKKLYLEQRLAIARLGCIKTIKEKRKIINLQNNRTEYTEPDYEIVEPDIEEINRREQELF